jgi:hypothetical protein
MKKILLTLLSGALLALNANAQVDFGYELPWSNGNPQGWASARLIAPNVVDSDNVVFHFGSKSVKIVTSDVSAISGSTNGLLPPTSGIMLTGSTLFGPPWVKLGYPFSQRKDSLGFFARYTPVGNDTAYAQVILYKRQTQRDTIAMGYTKITAASAFNLNYVVLNYNPNFPNTILPDSALIIFSSSMPVGAQLGSTLWVDDLKWGTVNTGITEITKNEAIKVAPVPASEFISFDFGKAKATRVEIIDVNGKQIESISVYLKNQSIGIAHLANGLYFYAVRDKENVLLSSGKITINH